MAEALDKLIAALGRLPGIGRRSAERIAMAILADPAGLGAAVKTAIDDALDELTPCRLCGNITPKTADPCEICTDPRRDSRLLCIVEGPGDILAMERAGVFKGRYHALMGRLSPMRGQGPRNLRLESLIERIQREGVREVLLALNSDVEGDATAAFLIDLLRPQAVTVTRLARGLPAGGGLAYADAETLARAIEFRQQW